MRAVRLLEQQPVPVSDAWTAEVTDVSPYRYRDRLVLTLRSADGAGPALKASAWAAKNAPLHEGDILAIRALPQPLDAAGSADLIRRGIGFSVRLDVGNWTLIRKAESSFRTTFRDRLVSLNAELYGAKNGGVMNALMLGDSFFVDKETTYDFTRAGVLHILAASGTHVAIVAAIPLFLLPLLRVPKKWAYAVTSAVLLLYFQMTCMPVSLLRACVMFWVLAAVRIAGRKADPLHALYLSGAIILILHPYDLYSLGFQLSYGATFGVIHFYRRFRDSLPRMPFRISDSIAMTLSAQVAVLPVLCLSIGELNLTGLLSNIVLVPATGFLFLGSIICNALCAIMPSAGNFLGHALSAAMDGNLWFAHQFARFPGHFTVASPPAWLVLPYAALCAPLLFRYPRRALGGACIAFSVAACFIPLAGASRPPSEMSLLQKNEKRSLFRDGEKALLYGGIRTSRERSAVSVCVRSAGYCRPSVYLDDFSPESLRESVSFIRGAPVQEVVLAEGVPVDGRLYPLLEALEADGITPVFERVSKNGCQQAPNVYLMKQRCETVFSALQVPDGGPPGIKIRYL